MDLDDSNTIFFVLDSTFSLSYQIWKIPKISKTVNILTKTISSQVVSTQVISFFLYILTSVEDIRQGLVYKCKGGLVE